MSGNFYSALVRLGRATVFCVGLAVILAVVLGVASTALAKKKDPTLKLNARNAVTAVTSMIGSVAGPVLSLKNDAEGPALGLRAGRGEAPLTVNEEAGRAINLDADEVDGKSASELEGARAYAQVLPTKGFPIGPQFVPSLTSGFTAVTSPQTGVHCLTPEAGISATNYPAVVSVEQGKTDGPEGNATAMIRSFTPGVCPSGDFEVWTERQTVVTENQYSTDGPYVLESNLENNVGFTIVVP